MEVEDSELATGVIWSFARAALVASPLPLCCKPAEHPPFARCRSSASRWRSRRRTRLCAATSSGRAVTSRSRASCSRSRAAAAASAWAERGAAALRRRAVPRRCGALYIRQGHELAASGARFTWDYKVHRDRRRARGGGGAGRRRRRRRGRWQLPRRAGVVTLMIDWSTIPRKQLRVEMLGPAADALAGALAARRYDDPSRSS